LQLLKRHLFGTLQVIQSFTKTGKEPFINLWTAALLTAALQILTRCMSGKQARQSMDWCARRMMTKRLR